MLTNPAIPLWLLVALFITWTVVKVLVFGALARKLGPKYLAILESLYKSRTAEPEPDLPPGLEKIFDHIAEQLGRQVDMCGNLTQLPPADEPWSTEKKMHACTLPRGHDGEHRCDCGQSWAVES